jgi:Protein of unknown function (DUF2891)
MLRHVLMLLCLIVPLTAPAAPTPPGPNVDGYAQLALTCIRQQYPNHLSLAVGADADVMPPFALHPAFYGCLDWHSAVHGHWLLVRLLKLHPDAAWAADARRRLQDDFTPGRLAREVEYFQQPNRASFERPYGLAWLLELTRELREWDDPDAQRWLAALLPLEQVVVERLSAYIPKLHYPIRIGEHNQTAFSFALIWDWAEVAGRTDVQALLRDAAGRFYAHDTACPLDYEPSGEDFLSPCLGEADFMRRVLPPAAYSRWLTAFLPNLGTGRALAPAVVTDRSDPKLAHLDGLNLSRAWMLKGIAGALPASDRRRSGLLALADVHAAAGLPAVNGEHYEGGHWLGTFAVYLAAH